MLPQIKPVGCGCRGATVAQSVRRSRSGRDLLAAMLSLGVWLVMPKCPICLAAHVAFWTGCGLTFGQAAYLRWSLMGASGVMFTIVLLRRNWRSVAVG